MYIPLPTTFERHGILEEESRGVSNILEKNRQLIRPISFWRLKSSLSLSTNNAGADIAIGTPNSAADKIQSRKQQSRAPNKETPLQQLINNIPRIQEQSDNDDRQQHISPSVLRALQKLANARNFNQTLQAERFLEQQDLAGECSVAVQERIIRAVSMTGLLNLALNWIHCLFLDQDILPSDMVQSSLCSGLRKEGRHGELELFLLKMGRVAAKTQLPQQTISLFAFNIYLASLSDQANLQNNNLVNFDQTTPKPQEYYLQQGLKWITTTKAWDELGIVPDAVSFTTLLQAAAETNNRTLSDTIWEYMTKQNIGKTTNAYNARLKALIAAARDDAQALLLWDEMIQDPHLSSTDAYNPYTIDLMLLPWERQESSSWETIETALNTCCRSTSDPNVLSHAFTSFLHRLTGSFSSLPTAQKVFDKYIGPRFKPLLKSNASEPLVWVKNPQTMQFNILLDAYRKNIDSCRKKNPHDEDAQRQEQVLVNQAWDLFKTLRNSPALVKPDPFSFCIMMGICATTEELCQLLRLSLHDRSYDGTKQKMANALIEPMSTWPMLTHNNAFLRAAITRFGELGDVSSSLYLFETCGGRELGQIRLWNVMLGAIAKSFGAKHGIMEPVIDTPNAPIVSVLQKQHDIASGAAWQSLSWQLQGSTYPAAAEKLLSIMNQQLDLGNGLAAPKPDSQSYCLVASSLQRIDMDVGRALHLFREAKSQGIPADGRFINALVRCFGPNINEALQAWKEEIRPACLAYENRAERRLRQSQGARKKNLLAAYHGLMYCCGRALRPDLAVRIAYAMRKEDLEPTEVSLSSYMAGKRERPSRDQETVDQASGDGGANQKPSFLRQVASRMRSSSWSLVAPYESILYVECSKYDQNDKRRLQEKRVRIIL